MNVCKCGCGEEVNEGKQWRQGHHLRSAEVTVREVVTADGNGVLTWQADGFVGVLHRTGRGFGESVYPREEVTIRQRING